MGVDQTVVTGSFPTGSSFPPGTHFSGATFEAPCTFGEGCIFENCTWECLRQCGTFGKQCCPVRSMVGEGAIITGGRWEYVDFESSGRMDGGATGPEGNVTLPDCIDCAPWGERGVAVDVTGTYIVSGGLYRSQADACTDRCTDNGILILNDGDTTVECATGNLTVSG